MRVALAAAAIAALVSAPAMGRSTVKHATGTFEVKMTPEASGEGPEGGLPTSRMSIAKTFSGGMTGTARGTMLAAGSPGKGAAAYVAVDQVQATIEGRSGGFVLLHRGTMTRDGESALSVTVAPDTGSGALAGIEGTLSIEIKDGQHRYDFAYTLPDAG